MARTDPTVYLRLPADLKAQLDAAAREHRRSITAEVVDRLQRSFEQRSEFEDLSMRLEALEAVVSNKGKK